jgi:hypothetical protein
VELNPGLPRRSTRIRHFLRAKTNLNLRQKIEEGYIWNLALYGAETCTLRKVGQKYLESFEMWCWRGMEKMRWNDRVMKYYAGQERKVYPIYNKKKVS